MRGKLAVILMVGWSASVGLAELAGGPTTPDRLETRGSTEISVGFSGNPIGVWSGGALMLVDHARSAAPVIRSFDRSGKEISQFTFKIPGASLINIYSGLFARGFDGSVAVAGSAYTEDSRGTAFVAWLSPTGREQTVIRVSPFAPGALTVAADGAIWTTGWEGQGKEVPDYQIFRRYNKSGKLLASFIPRSSLTLGNDTSHYYSPEHAFLVSTKDRVGWYSPPFQTYLEFSLDGSVLSRFSTVPLGAKQRLIGVALCDDGGLFAGVQSFGNTGSAERREVFTLDRNSRKWSPVPMVAKMYVLYGCDATSLAAGAMDPAITWLSPIRK